jgi:hypothetical protein
MFDHPIAAIIASVTAPLGVVCSNYRDLDPLSHSRVVSKGDIKVGTAVSYVIGCLGCVGLYGTNIHRIHCDVC